MGSHPGGRRTRGRARTPTREVDGGPGGTMGFARHFVPTDVYSYGPTYKASRLLHALDMEPADDAEEVPQSDAMQTVVPVEGFEFPSDLRYPCQVPCECELPTSLRARISDEEWRKEVRPLLNAGLAEHFNAPRLLRLAPLLSSACGLSILGMLVYMTARNATSSSDRSGTRELGALVGVFGFLCCAQILIVLTDHFRNVDMERRCAELTQRWRAKNLAFSFFATRRRGLIKSLKFVVVLHQAPDGVAEAAKLAKNPKAMQLCAVQRRYTRQSVDQGQLAARPAPRMTIIEEGPQDVAVAVAVVEEETGAAAAAKAEEEAPLETKKVPPPPPPKKQKRWMEFPSVKPKEDPGGQAEAKAPIIRGLSRKRSVHFNPIVEQAEEAVETGQTDLPQTINIRRSSVALKPPSPM